MSGLTEQGQQILDFERRSWQAPAAKEHAIAEILGLDATRYYQLLNELLDQPEALIFDPVLVNLLRSQRTRRRRVRAPLPTSLSRRRQAAPGIALNALSPARKRLSRRRAR